MSQSIQQLETKRQALLDTLSSFGAFRRGTISVNYRTCGKAGCACQKDKAKQHGPQYLWNATIDQKSYSKNLHLGPEVEKYVIETDTYRAFQTWCKEFIAINEALCQALPVEEISSEEALETLKKKLRKRLCVPRKNK